MRRLLFGIAVLTASCLVGGCGSTSVGNSSSPTTPSPTPAPAPPAPAPQPFPSLTGDWRSVGSSVTFTNQATGSTSSYDCFGAVRVSTQTGGEFSGAGGLTGNGRSSDPYCSFSGSFSGVETADGSVTSFHLQLPLGVFACTPVSGYGTFTGAASAAGPIRLAATDQWRCMDPPGQPFDGLRTVSLTFQRQ